MIPHIHLIHLSEEQKQTIKDHEIELQCPSCKENFLLTKDMDFRNEYFILDLGKKK
jgi:hypothetical protein